MNASRNPADNILWAFKSGDIVQLDFDTGEILDTITHQQVHRANPDISIFTPRRRIHKGNWLSDPFHENDVAPLTPKLASAFPHQGRVLEVNDKGETVFEFVNTYDDAETLIMSEVRWFPEDYFSVDFNDPNLCN